MVEMSVAAAQDSFPTKKSETNTESKLIEDAKSEEDAKEVDPSMLPSIRYSREELLILEKSDLAILRPDYLECSFDRDGLWDPMQWHSGSEETDLVNGTGGPVGTLEFRKRTRSNAEAKDAEVVLSPQRMSFLNGCTGSKQGEEGAGAGGAKAGGRAGPKGGSVGGTAGVGGGKFEKEPRSRDPDREKHLQNYSGNREQIRKAIRDLHENRSKEAMARETDEDTWQRGEYIPEYRPYKDTKYSNGGNGGGGGGGGKRGWNPRHNSEASNDDAEPEWFTSGPTSRLEIIELKGFEDDDEIHSKQAVKVDQTKRENELAMDPLGNPEMTSNQFANESSYSTGLQEDWDPTNPKFNIGALHDPEAFFEEGKDLLEAERSMPGGGEHPSIDLWGNPASSSPKDFPISPHDRPDPSKASDIQFGENIATCNLKAMLGVNIDQPGIPEMPGLGPGSSQIRPNMDDPIMRQLLADRPGTFKQPPPHDLMGGVPRNIREMLFQRSQSEHLPPPGPMLPHPGPVMQLRQPNPEQLLRELRLNDPRMVDPRIVDPRIVDPRFNIHSPAQMKPGMPQNGPELLKAVKKDPAQIDKVITCLQNALKNNTAPPESKKTMLALLQDMEKAKAEHLRFQMLTKAQHHFQKQNHEAQMHDKTQALKALLRLPGQGAPLLTAPARMGPMPPPQMDQPFMRPRMAGDESIPTRITSHQNDPRMMNKGPFSMAFTPTSVMIKSSERGGGFKEDSSEMNINLTPAHMHPAHMRGPPIRSAEGMPPGMPRRTSPPHMEDGPKPVPTIETSRAGIPKLPFPGPFTPPHPMGIKGLPPNFMVHPQLAKGIPPSPRHIPSQLLMQELMHSNKPSPTFNHPIPPMPKPNAQTF